jgi:HEAT repeat protein
MFVRMLRVMVLGLLCGLLGWVGRAQSEASLPDLLALLREPDAYARTRALYAMLENKPDGLEEHYERIIDLLDEKERVLHRQPNGVTIATSPSEAAMKLMAREGARAVPSLSVALINQRTSVRWRAAHLLGQIANPAALEALVGAVTQDSDALVRMTASEALVKLGPAIVPNLLELLDSTKPQEREQAVWILSEIGDERTVDPLLRIALEEQNRLAARAEDALLKMGPRIVPTVLRVVEGDYDQPVKMRALQIASRLNDPIALEAITYTLLTHPDNELRARALIALASHTDNPYLTDALLNVLFDIDRRFARLVPDIMGRLDSRAGLILETYLANPSQQIQDVAIEGLRAMGTRSLPSFVYAVDNEALSHGARVACSRMLRRYGYRTVPFRTKVTAMVLAEDWSALAPITRQVRSELVKFASAPQRELREGALTLLAEIKAADLVPLFVDRLEDPEAGVRLAAERALRATERIGFPQLTHLLDKRIRRSVRAVAFLLEENGYRPRTDLDRVRLFAAKETWQQLESLGESGLAALLESLNSTELPVSAWAAWTLARYAVHTSLERVGLKDFDPTLHEILYETAEDRLSAGFRTLGGAADRTSVAYLLVPLLGEDENRQQLAATAIGIAGVPALEMLELFLKSDLPRLRERALVAAEQIGSGAVNMLLKFLFDEEIGPDVLRILDRLDYRPEGNEEERYYLLAAREYERLARMGRVALEPLRLAAIKPSNPDRIEAILALGRLREPGIALDLLRLMNDSDVLIREAAINALNLLGAEAYEPLKRQTTDGNLVLANLAALALDKLGYTPANEQERIWLAAARQDWPLLRAERAAMVRHLRPNLLTQNNTVRAISTAAFASLRDLDVHTEERAFRQFQERMARGLFDEDPNVRAIAARYAGRFGEGAAAVVPRLVQLLDDDNAVVNPEATPIDIPLPSTVAGAAAGALARIGAPAVQELSRVMDSENSRARLHARLAIAAISDPRLLAFQVRLLNEPDPDLRYQTCLTLGRSGRREAVPPLLNLALSAPPKVRKAALHGIRLIGGRGEETLLEELRTATDNTRRILILQSLAALRSPAVLDAFTRHVDDADLYVRKAAFAGLVRQGGDDAYRLAVRGLKDDFWTVRESVLQQVVSAGKPSLGVMVEEMPRQDPVTARHIERILQEISGESFGSDANAWRRWWLDNKDSLLLPPSGPRRI